MNTIYNLVGRAISDFIMNIFFLVALTRLLTSLKEVQSGGEDLAFLSELLQSKQLHALVQVHNKIVAKGKDDKFYPLLSNAMQVTLEVLDLLGDMVSSSKEYDELLSVLQKPHFQVSKLPIIVIIQICNFVYNILTIIIHLSKFVVLITSTFYLTGNIVHT